MTPEEADSLPVRRVVLLGASNLAVGLPVVVPAAQLAWGKPLDVLAAIGHGRGYGCESRVLGRVLPPIVECGLWQALSDRPPAATAVLLTDVGNDLVLGADSQQLVAWVEQCLERLVGLCERLTITELPLVSLEKLGQWRFRFMRTALFPTSRLGFQEALDSSKFVNAELLRLAEQYGAATVAPDESWFGFDPIHIRRSRRKEAWRSVFSPWCDGSPTDLDGAVRHSAWYLYRLRPLERKLFLVHQHQPQPAGRLRDGSTISLF